MLPAELLAENPLFDTMAPEDIEGLSKKLVEHNIEAGKKIFGKGEAGASMYIIRSGAIEIFLPPEKDSPRVILRELRSGQYFGELSLFDGKPRSASAEATTKTELFELRRDDFADYLSRSKPATMAILSELAERLRETNNLLSQRAAKHVIKEIEENLTWGQRMADKVAAMNGSWGFIFMLLTCTITWALLNAFIPKPFDQYPYQFFNFALAVLVSLQGPLDCDEPKPPDLEGPRPGRDGLSREPQERDRDRNLDPGAQRVPGRDESAP